MTAQRRGSQARRRLRRLLPRDVPGPAHRRVRRRRRAGPRSSCPVLVVNRLDDYFTSQQTDGPRRARNDTVSVYVQSVADDATPARSRSSTRTATLDPAVVTVLSRRAQQRFIADYLARPTSIIDFGLIVSDRDGRLRARHEWTVRDAARGRAAEPGQTREATSDRDDTRPAALSSPYAVRVTLANPYTFRATAIANVPALLGGDRACSRSGWPCWSRRDWLAGSRHRCAG